MLFVHDQLGVYYRCDDPCFDGLYEHHAPCPEGDIGQTEVDSYPPRDPKLTEREHYQLWINTWRKQEKSHWRLVDSWTPLMFTEE